MEIKRSGRQPSGKGPTEYFTGAVRIDPLFEAPDPARARAPGAHPPAARDAAGGGPAAGLRPEGQRRASGRRSVALLAGRGARVGEFLAPFRQPNKIGDSLGSFLFEKPADDISL